MGLAACEFDRIAGTEFEINPGREEFKFTAQSNNFAPHNTEAGEALRMRHLNRWLQENGLCQNGFVITNRSDVFVGGALHNITYLGTCV